MGDHKHWHNHWNWQKENWPNWEFSASKLEGYEKKFLINSGKLLGAWAHLSRNEQQDMTVELLSSEAMKSSEIEGEYLDRASVQSSIMRGFGMKTDRRASAPEAGIADLMLSVFREFDQPMNDELLFTWHRFICQGRSDMEAVGKYRRHNDPMQVVSGAIYKPKVHFEAPPTARVEAEMIAFTKWMGQGNLPALTKAGLAHLYFVSIHPFEDGNGRMARAISEYVLANALGQGSLITLSRQIEKTRKAYYDRLETNNKSMNVDDWLMWFAQTVLDAQNHSIALVEHIIKKTRLLEGLRGQLNARQTSALQKMFDAGPEGFECGLSANNYMSITGATVPTTTRDLADLVAKGALRRTGERKSTRYLLS